MEKTQVDGEFLAIGLAQSGWSVVVDARDATDLDAAADRIRSALGSGAGLAAIPGDVTDPSHRADLVAAAVRLGGVDLLVNNAGTLGPTPLPPLVDVPLDGLRDAFEANLAAPLGMIQASASELDRSPAPRVVNITSDASVEAYPGWGAYGITKAALDHLSAVLTAERPSWTVWAFDPGDMRTAMHQDAFPGEDISDRPEPESVVPALLALLGSKRPSGRVRASQLEAAPA